ncbi:MAG: response regulator, partial [Cyclobacteriaceae bacterium]|nr:response regulator [Cyclobacteriaceae bacterium]
MGKKHLPPEDMISDFKSSEHIDHYIIHESTIDPKISDDTIVQHNSEDEKLKVLIADDNQDILIYLKSIFEQSYTVETVTNGKEGLNIAFEKIPDLIISDIMMPEMDGLELCRRIKSDVRTSHIPVILLTARTAHIFQTEGLEIGADDYITKPFDERVLFLKVKNLIASRADLRKKYSKEIT